jgi:hypothetical protein
VPPIPGFTRRNILDAAEFREPIAHVTGADDDEILGSHRLEQTWGRIDRPFDDGHVR